MKSMTVMYISPIYFRQNLYDAGKIRQISPFLIQDPLLNSALCKANESLARIAEVIGEDPHIPENWAKRQQKPSGINYGTSSMRYSTLMTLLRTGLLKWILRPASCSFMPEQRHGNRPRKYTPDSIPPHFVRCTRKTVLQFQIMTPAIKVLALQITGAVLCRLTSTGCLLKDCDVMAIV